MCALDPLDKDVELDGIIELFEIHWIYSPEFHYVPNEP